MVYTKNSDTRDVMMEMNTTPLIDVLLVLLIMLIITIPVSTHAVKLDLPVPRPDVAIDHVKNVLVIDQNGTLAWNGTRVNRGELRVLLDESRALPRPPELHLAPVAQAPYGVVDSVLALTKRAQLSRVGFVGNEAYESF